MTETSDAAAAPAQAVATAERARSGFRRPAWTRSIWVQCAALVIVWRLVMVVLGQLLGVFASAESPLPFPSTPLWDTARWDSEWYLKIIADGYAELNSGAFYPMFPGIVLALRALTFGLVDTLLLGAIANSIALVCAFRALHWLGEYFGLPVRTRWFTVAVLLTAPPALFLHMFYTEPTFLALGMWAYVFALRRNWPMMGILLAGVTASRLAGLLVVALCGLEYLRAKGWWSREVFRWEILWVPFGVVGFGVFALICWSSYGDPLAMLQTVYISPDWRYHVFQPNIVLTVVEQIAEVFHQIASGTLARDTIFRPLVPLIGLAVLLAASIYLIVAKGSKAVPLAVMGFLAFMMFTLNSNVVSVHRYVLSYFGIPLAAGLYLQRHPGRSWMFIPPMVAGVALQLLCYYLWLIEVVLIA